MHDDRAADFRKRAEATLQRAKLDAEIGADDYFQMSRPGTMSFNGTDHAYWPPVEVEPAELPGK
jgi:hypothetical protein